MTQYNKLSNFFNAIIGGEWGKEPTSTSMVSVLRTTNFHNDGTIDYSHIALRDISPSRIKEKALVYQDIIIEKSGGSDKQPVGRVVFFEKQCGEMLCNNFTQILRVDRKKYYPKYVFYYLYFLYLSGATIPYQNKTTGIRNLQLTAYLNMPVKNEIPSQIEQKRLAERLDKVQELIAKQKEQIAKLDLLIKSRFLDMFGDPITNPKNWPLFPLGKFISISGGFAFPSSEFKESGLPIVRIGNINSGVFKDDHFVFYQENEKLRKYLVYPDDLVLSLTGTVGKDDYANICFIGKKYARYYLNQRNAKLVLTSNLDKTFIWQIFKSPEIKKRLTSLNRGVRQANISNQDILNLKVIYPDLFLQTQFANFVKSVEQQKEVFSARLSHLEILYKSLMQEYFG